MKQLYVTPEIKVSTYCPEEVVSTSFGENIEDPF